MVTAMALLALIMFMRFGPDVPARRWLNHQLAEKPVAAMLGKKRHHLIFLLIVCALLVFGGEILLLLGPEFALTYAADLALYLDIAVVGTLVSGVGRARDVVRFLLRSARVATKRMAGLPGRGSRARQTRRPRAAKPANNDDDAGPGLLLAA